MPIKRNLNIKELSRDHHFGLLFCWKVKEGIKKNVFLERINKYVCFFWKGHLQPHFLEEELLLFNNVNDALCDKALEEHRLIRAQVENIASQNNLSKHHYLDLIEAINNHIRFEERVLFPHLEIILSGEILNKIGLFLASDQHSSFKDNYGDEFWLSKKVENGGD